MNYIHICIILLNLSLSLFLSIYLPIYRPTCHVVAKKTGFDDLGRRSQSFQLTKLQMQLSYISTVAPWADAVIAGHCPFRVSFLGDQVCLCHCPGCPIFLSNARGRIVIGRDMWERVETGWTMLNSFHFWDVLDWCHRLEQCRLIAWP